MSNNKKIGFDVLENSDINIIEEIGTDKMNIDKSARDRMLKNTMRKYESEKQKLGISSDKAPEDDNGADYVSGVEVYESKKLPHIILIALCSAAAVVLTFGCIKMLKNSKPIIVTDDPPFTELTTTTASNLTTSALNRTTSTTSDEKATETDTSTGTGTETSTTTSTTTAAVTVTAPLPTETYPYVCHNPHMNRTDITQEELDAARVRALEYTMNHIDHPGSRTIYEPGQRVYPMWNIEYCSVDINGDSIPELFVRYENFSGCLAFMLIYDGNEYVAAGATVNCIKINDTGDVDITANIFKICPEEHLIYTLTKEGALYTEVLELSPDNTITTHQEYHDYNGYYKDGQLIARSNPENINKDAINEYDKDLNTHKWQDLEYTLYAEKNEEAKSF
ncbi:MAG: hypothetical protein IKW96_08155 [Ruminococcus sp.]|uniref:hypothetical protein n=1 Tax=Ruminococcus sp. TaxID=41978 RepID=UPI0025D06FB8|nr:hypothetical protein [Ruminococcus sp.]MBR5683235.1 hypothetical protein [Ruminococcus sp.]